MEPLLFDLEDTDHQLINGEPALHPTRFDFRALAHKLELAARHPTELARQLHGDVVREFQSLKTERSSTATVRGLAARLAGRGYNVVVRAALGGGTDCFRSLRHEFLVVHGSGDFCGMEFLVEPSLRQHFAIPHPSPEYAFVLAAAPDVFVGGSCRLVPIVQLLCAMMADSFERQGLALPPWRKEAAMLSKWLPQPNRLYDMKPVVHDGDDAAAAGAGAYAWRPVTSPSMGPLGGDGCVDCAVVADSVRHGSLGQGPQCCVTATVTSIIVAAAAADSVVRHCDNAASPFVAAGYSFDSCPIPLSPTLRLGNSNVPRPAAAAAAAAAGTGIAAAVPAPLSAALDFQPLHTIPFAARRCNPIPLVAVTGFFPRAAAAAAGSNKASASGMVPAAGAGASNAAATTAESTQYNHVSDFDCGSPSLERSLDASSVHASSIFCSPPRAAAGGSILFLEQSDKERPVGQVGGGGTVGRPCCCSIIDIGADVAADGGAASELVEELLLEDGDDGSGEEEGEEQEATSGRGRRSPRLGSTGMLPCPLAGTGLLSARLLLSAAVHAAVPNAAAATAPTAAAAVTAAAVVVSAASSSAAPSSASFFARRSAGPSSISSGVTTPGGGRVESLAPLHPSGPVIHLVRRSYCSNSTDMAAIPPPVAAAPPPPQQQQQAQWPRLLGGRCWQQPWGGAPPPVSSSSPHQHQHC